MVNLVPVNPFDRTGFLLPFVIQRMIEQSRQHMSEMSPQTWAKLVSIRLTNGDDKILVLAAVGEKGDVVGHLTCSIETDGSKSWLFVSQCRVDPGEGSSDSTLVRRALEYVDKWGSERGVSLMVMATPRSDEAWRRKYGFKTLRHLMSREIGSPIGAAKEGAEG